MKIIIFILFIFFQTLIFCNGFANDNYDDRKKELISLVDEELFEIKRLNKQNKGSNPIFLLRMAELLLEKARLIKEKENSKYLSLSVKRRQKIKKNRYFRESRKYFKEAQKICFYMLKRFPNLRQKTDVYYILGSNAKEFQDYKRAKKYYKRAAKGSSSNKKLKIKAKIALAEIHYNDGEYGSAIKLYDAALRNHRDKWWTKDAYNLAWAYFKKRKYSKAISTMKKVYKLSKNPQFIDYSKKAASDLGYFYSNSGNPNKAEQFYVNSGQDVGKNLVKVGKHLLSAGSYAAAEKTFVKALRSLKDDRKKISINILLLELYDKSGKYGKHLETCKRLLSYYSRDLLESDEKKMYIFQLKKVAAVLQNQVVSKTYLHDKRKRSIKAKRAVKYFEILAIVEPEKSYMHLFAAAETFFVVKEYNRSVDYYDKSYQKAKEKGATKIMKLAQKGLIVAVEKKGVSREKKKKYTTQVYSNFLKNHPRSKEAYKIYQRTFTLYMNKKEVGKAEETLLTFKKYFPKERVKQEAMLAKIMDHYKNTGNRAKFASWVNRIKRGEFVVNKKYAKRLNKILMSMQFENVQGLLSKGDKKKALVSYVGIYKDEGSSAEEKKYAAYNIMLLFYELRNIKYTLLWAERALDLLKAKEVVKFEDTFITIANEMFDRRKFQNSVFIFEKVLHKICRTSSKKKNILFKNTYIIYLSMHKVDEVRDLIKKTSSCKISRKIISQTRLEILKSLIDLRRWNTVDDILSSLERRKELWIELIKPTWDLIKVLKSKGRISLTHQKIKKIMNYYYYAKKNKKEIPLEGLDAIANIKIDELNKEVEKYKAIKLSFPEKLYNKRLKKKLEMINIMTDKALKVLSIGSGAGLVSAYKILVENYNDIVQQMRQFNPPGKSKSYVKTFKKSMYNVSMSLSNEAKKFKREALGQISRNNILSDENYLFFTKNKTSFKIRYLYSKGGVLMDRGGRR